MKCNNSEFKAIILKTKQSLSPWKTGGSDFKNMNINKEQVSWPLQAKHVQFLFVRGHTKKLRMQFRKNTGLVHLQMGNLDYQNAWIEGIEYGYKTRGQFERF